MNRAAAFLVIGLIAAVVPLRLAIADQSSDHATGPGPSISFPGVHLTRGMSKERVLNDLAPLFRIQRLEAQDSEVNATEEESYLVRDKLDPDGTVGVVTFTHGKLSWASRAWAYADDPQSLELAGRLCSLIEHLERERGSGAAIKANTLVQHGVTVQNIGFLFGNKKASITIFKEKTANGDWKMREVHVDEALQEQNAER
jgi:hypothetical protein